MQKMNAEEKGGRQLINKAVIIPTGDELKSGIVLDTDSPMIMQVIPSINNNCNIIRNKPVKDAESAITNCIRSYAEQDVDLIVLIGGSGGGHRHSSTLGKDFTHSSLDSVLDIKHTTELYGKNGHLWSKIVCGIINKTVVINVPGPYQEARAAIEAFKRAFEENKEDLKLINARMAEAVKLQYGTC